MSKTKEALIKIIADTLRERKLTQVEAAKLLSSSQPEVSCLINHKIENFSTDRLLDYLVGLGCNIQISVKASSRKASVTVKNI